MTQLLDILNLEKTSKFLPVDVAYLVMKLIDVREEIFSSAAKRFSSDYRYFNLYAHLNIKKF